MLPTYLETIKFLLLPSIRLMTLSSNTEFGKTEIHDEHLVEKLNAFVENFKNPKFYELYQQQFIVPNSLEKPKSSDIILGEQYRMFKHNREKFFKNQIDISELRKIDDYPTKIHRAVSRGLERKLVDHFNKLDSEAYDLKILKDIL